MINHPYTDCPKCGTRLREARTSIRLQMKRGVVTGFDRPLPRVSELHVVEWCPNCHSAWRCDCDECLVWEAFQRMI